MARACRAREPEWRPVPGARRYDISDAGVVREANTGRILAQTASGRNNARRWHLSVSLMCDDGERRNLWVSRLVLLAHVGPAADGVCALHRDDNPSNNALSNLYWGTAEDNLADARRNGGFDRSRAASIESKRQSNLTRLRAELASLAGDQPRPKIKEHVLKATLRTAPGEDP